jgi:hypothetical protein
MSSQCEFDFLDEKLMIIEMEGRGIGGKKKCAEVRLSTREDEFVFLLTPENLKKLVVCGIRYLKNEPGYFYGDHFHVGHGSEQKEFPAKDILKQYSLR